MAKPAIKAKENKRIKNFFIKASWQLNKKILYQRKGSFSKFNPKNKNFIIKSQQFLK